MTGSNPWRPDRSGVQPGGDDAGGDIQVGQAWSVRYVRDDLPGAMITRTAYPVEYDECPGEFIVQVQTEFLVCRDVMDPGGTEIWSEYEYDDEAEIYDSAAKAESAAQRVATELLDDASSHMWDGQSDWTGPR